MNRTLYAFLLLVSYVIISVIIPPPHVLHMVNIIFLLNNSMNSQIKKMLVYQCMVYTSIFIKTDSILMQLKHTYSILKITNIIHMSQFISMKNYLLSENNIVQMQNYYKTCYILKNYVPYFTHSKNLNLFW